MFDKIIKDINKKLLTNKEELYMQLVDARLKKSLLSYYSDLLSASNDIINNNKLEYKKLKTLLKD